MTSETIAAIGRKLSRWDESHGAGVDEQAVQEAERLTGVPFHIDYREFLERFGSAMLGPLPIYGLSPAEALGDDWSVVEMTSDFRRQQWPEVDNWAVVSMDQSGNPIGIDRQGTIWTYDHDQGEKERLASSFEEFVRKSCLRFPD